MKGWGKIKSIDSLSDRINRLEVSNKIKIESSRDSIYNDGDIRAFATVEDWFNWRIQNILPSYKLEVMGFHNISEEEEYSRRVLRRRSVHLLTTT